MGQAGCDREGRSRRPQPKETFGGPCKAAWGDEKPLPVILLIFQLLNRSVPVYTASMLSERINEINILRTERLILRWFEERDIEDMFEYARDPETVEYLTWPAHPNIEFTRGKFSEWFKAKPGMFAIELASEGKCVGCIDLRIDQNNDKASFGYVLNRAYWNRGIMTEALCEIIRLTFAELGLNRIEATHYAGNDKSGRVMEKAGMRFEGTGKQELIIKGKYVDVVHYGLTREDREALH